MARKVCTLCQLRPVGYGTNGDQAHAIRMGYCTPCLTEAEWENEHSDHDHKGILATPEGQIPAGWFTAATTIKRTKAQKLAEVAAERERVALCWECHPDLNEAQRPYTPRTRRQPAAASARRTQLDHKHQCKHPQTPAARRACREEYWAAENC
jgi:hypothetical protein